MKTELDIAVSMKKKGYLYALQITTDKGPFGESIYMKSANEAGPLLRSIGEDAKIEWTYPIDEYIKKLTP